jgi:cytochrome c oxidase assembly factor CtaG
VALVYARGWFRIRRSFPSAISARRLAGFMVGLSSLWIAVASPLAAFHHALLSVHMVQHVVLMAVAPPLILIGAPSLPLEFGLPWGLARRAVHWVRRSRATRSLRRVITHPLVCWCAPITALIGWHVPAVFELGVRSRWWHDVQATSFFATGVLFWLPVVRWPSGVMNGSRWLIPVYLFAATLPCDALSAFLVFCDRVVYPSYLSAAPLLSVSPLHDQEFAGALMWVSVTLIYLLPAVVITIELLSPPRTDSIGAARRRAAVERSARRSADRHASFPEFLPASTVTDGTVVARALPEHARWTEIE